MRRKIFWWILTVLWCILIFLQSGKTAAISGNESSMVADFINYCIEVLTGQSGVTVNDMLVRKTAHYLEYFVLGALLFAAFYNRQRLFATLCLSIALGVLYAATDEIHQYFIPGRAMRLYDVAIDTAGILTSVLISYSFMNYKRKRIAL